MVAFLGIDGRRLTLTNDAAYDFVVAVASGQLDEIAEIAARIRASTEAW
jgi:death-on-curing protein